MGISFGGWETTASVAFIEACPSIGVPIVKELNDGNGIGVRQGMLTVDGDFQRTSSYDGYYNPVRNRTNLTVRSLAGVQSLMMGSEGNTTIAKGVTFFDQLTASPYIVTAEKEVILSAGFIQSPQLLMTAVSIISPHP